jgi:hypothetical protein
MTPTGSEVGVIIFEIAYRNIASVVVKHRQPVTESAVVSVVIFCFVDLSLSVVSLVKGRDLAVDVRCVV